MAVFAAQDFTAADATVITSLTNSTGGTWAKNTVMSTNAVAPAVTSNNLRSGETSVNSIYRATETPPSADYPVTLRYQYNTSSSGTIAGPCARMASAAGDGYFAIFFEATGEFRLYKYVANTLTYLSASVVLSPSAAMVLDFTIECVGTALTARVQRQDNSEWLSAAGAWQSAQTNCLSATDSSVTAAGFAGTWLSHSNLAAGEAVSFSAGTPGSGPVITGRKLLLGVG